jgi:hypothetical protein
MGLITSKQDNFNTLDYSDIDDEHIIPYEFKTKILKEFILPYYKNNIEYVINEKTIWSRIGTGFLTTSTILIGAASILSFASGTYTERNLNFVAGSVGMVALVLKEFASYANSVDHIKTLTINDLLKNIGIKHSLNDSSKNFKKVIEDTKIDTPSPIGNELDTKFDILLSNLTNIIKNKNNINSDSNDNNVDIENNIEIGLDKYNSLGQDNV